MGIIFVLTFSLFVLNGEIRGILVLLNKQIPALGQQWK